jgi:predicted acetyltransferase
LLQEAKGQKTMPANMGIVLTPMSAGRDAEFEEMLAEFRAAGEIGVYKGHHAIAWEGYPAFYDLLTRMKPGGYPTPDVVPMDSYFIEADGRILGELYIRHRLSPRLEKIGGHVGYKVRPTERNRGIATAALRLALQRLHKMGMERALVTCNDTNIASARVIEACGGVRIDDAETEQGIERRYWVPIAP